MERVKLFRHKEQDDTTIDPDWQIPCDVRIVRRGRRTIVPQGCALRTLVDALKAREDSP